MKNFFASLISFAVLFTLVVIVLGAYTRLSDAGLGCPDWPGCYGHLTVPESVDNQVYQRPLEPAKAWMEMIHRYAAGTLGLLVLLIFGLSVFFSRKIKQTAWVPALLLATVTFQALLGMWTVTMLLSPLIVTAHLIGGFTTLSLLWWLWLRQHATQLSHFYVSGVGALRFFASIALLLVIGQIILGGWVSTHYAAVACGVDFPQCQGHWWPTMDFAEGFSLHFESGVNYEFGVLENPARTAIHMMHRMGAVVVFLYLLIFSWLLIRADHRFLGMTPKVMLLLLFTQVTLGIINVVMALPLWNATAHNLVAALLLLSVITLNQRLYLTR